MSDDFDSYLANAQSNAQPSSFDAYLAANAGQQATPVATPAAASGMTQQDFQNMLDKYGLSDDIAGGQLAQAAIHNVMKPLHGAAQLIEHGLGGAANLVAPDSSVAQFFNKDNAQNDAAIQQWEQNYQNSVPDNAASYTGAGIGNALSLAGGVGERLGQAGDYVGNLIPRLPSLARKVISGMTQGGVLSATQPVTAPTGGTVGDLVSGNAGPSFLDQKLHQAESGALIGGGIPILAGAGNGVYGALKPLVNPTGSVRDYLSNLLGNKAPQVLQSLQNAPSFVPGSMPTAAQAAGTPELVMAEKALSNQFPAFRAAQMERANANNTARIGALQGVAGSPADLAAAKAARKAVTDPQKAALLTNGNPVDPQPVLDTLSQLRNSSLGVRPTIKGAINDLESEINSRTQNGMISADELDGLRQNVGDYLKKNAPMGSVGSQEGVAFGPVKDQISQAIERANPGYLNYLADYGRLSQPITDARAASGILDRMGNGSLNSAQQVQLTPRGFNAALKQATKGPYPLSQNAQDVLGGIQNDLQRDTISNSVRASGSDTAYNLAANGWLASKLYGPTFQGNGMLPKLIGGAAGSVIPGIGTLGGYLGMGKLADVGASRLGSAITDVMMDPAKMAAQLQALQQKNPQAAAALQRYLTQQSALQVGQQAGQ